MQPIAYKSWKLNPVETRYSAYERELLGIVWSIGKWRHCFEGRKFIAQTYHSSLRHLSNRPSVSRRIWIWVGILQGYDMEIRHIPGKVNPADTITRQVEIKDAEYTGQVKRMDQELVDMIRIPSTATDEEVQRKLDQLYSKEGMNEKKVYAKQQILTEKREEQNAVLAVSESRIQIDDQFRSEIMQALKNEDQYEEMIQKLEDPEQPNDIQVNDRVYRIKNGTLKVHERNQKASASYWRTVIPNDVGIKRMILKELHCVPYVGHPGFTRTLEVATQFFYWTHMSPDVRDFVLDCPVCQVEKGSHLKPAGELQPLELPSRKWDHVAIDFVTGLPICEGKDTILTVVDKATKMCHFIACVEMISAKEVAKLYW